MPDRYEKVVGNLISELEILRIKKEFQSKVKAAVDKNQRDYILREQLKIIREELGGGQPSFRCRGI